MLGERSVAQVRFRPLPLAYTSDMLVSTLWHSLIFALFLRSQDFLDAAGVRRPEPEVPSVPSPAVGPAAGPGGVSLMPMEPEVPEKGASAQPTITLLSTSRFFAL